MWIEIYGFLDHLWDLTWYLIVLRQGYGLLGYGTTCWEILEWHGVGIVNNTSHIPQMIKSGTFNTIHQLNREVNCHYWKGWDFMFQHLFGWFLFRNPRNGTISRPVESLNMQSLMVTQLEEVDHCCWGDESWPRLCPFGNNRGAGSWLIPSIIIETCC